MTDPIVEEVRKARDEYAARFNYDLVAMVADLREQEKCWDREVANHAKAETASVPAPVSHDDIAVAPASK